MLPNSAWQLCWTNIGGTRELRLSGETRSTQSASGLLICGLQQRLLSSVEAFSKTLHVHRRTVKKQREAALAHRRLGFPDSRAASTSIDSVFSEPAAPPKNLESHLCEASASWSGTDADFFVAWMLSDAGSPNSSGCK